jgi:hypothetical protein
MVLMCIVRRRQDQVLSANLEITSYFDGCRRSRARPFARFYGYATLGVRNDVTALPGRLYPSTSRPFRSTRFNSFNEGPLGFFSPRSHFCTVEGLVFR